MRWLHIATALALCARGALGAAYGPAKTQTECAADHVARDALYLNGELEPYFSTGPPAECDQAGCLDGFWGARSRHQMEPTCPKDLVTGLTGWLRERAAEGAQWAVDALILQPCDMWQHMRGHTTWVVGDSVTEAVGAAITTFMIEYWDREHWDVKLSTDERVIEALTLGVLEGAPPGAGGKRVPYWCFQMGTLTDPGRLCYIKADKVMRSLHVLNVLPSISQPNDVLLINVGIHYNEMEQLTDEASMLAHALGNPALPKHRLWVETPPQHYETTTGMFNMTRPIKEQLCYPAGHAQRTNLTIFPDGSIRVPEGHTKPDPGSPEDIALDRIIRGGDRNLATQPWIDAAGVTTLRMWNYTLPLYQFHTHLHLPGEGECDEIMCDCTHTCFPSSPQIVMASFPRTLAADQAMHHSRSKGWHDHLDQSTHRFRS